MPKLFLAMTPYHIFLASSYVHRTAQDMIVLLDQNQTLTDYSDFPKLIFENYRYFAIKQGRQKSIFQMRQLKNIILKDIAKIQAKQHTSDLEIFAFNDSTIQTQYLFQALNPKNTYYMEDGSAPYNQHFIKHSKIKQLAVKIILGSNASLPNILGTSRTITASILTFPNLSRAENNQKTRIQFETSTEKLEQTVAMFSKHPRIQEIKASHNSKKSALILLPPTQPGNQEIAKMIDGVVENCINRGMTVYLKKHPLSQDQNSLEQNLNIKIVPSSIPAEVIPFFANQISEIYSTPNTALLTYAYFHKSIESFCITDRQSIDSDRLTQNIIQLGSTALLSEEQ